MMRPQNLSIIQYEQLELQCSVNLLTTLTPKFSWNFTKRGHSSPVKIVEENKLLTSAFSFQMSLKNSTLFVKSAKWIHNGIYMCIVSGGNDVIQAESTVNVLSKLHLDN